MGDHYSLRIPRGKIHLSLPRADHNGYITTMQANEETLKILIADVSMTSRLALERILSDYGHCDSAEDVIDALKAFTLALELGMPYDLVCIDIKMPRIGGIEAIKMMRKIEREMGVMKANEVRIFVITAVNNPAYIFEACYRGGANAYLYKPVERNKLTGEMVKAGLIGKSQD